MKDFPRGLFLVTGPTGSGKSTTLAAIIERRGSEWWLRDLDSSNGTYVSGRRIKEVMLTDGAEILLGSMRLVFQIESSRFLLEGRSAATVTDQDGRFTVPKLRRGDYRVTSSDGSVTTLRISG